MIVDVEGSNKEYVSGTASLPAFTNLGEENYNITLSNGGYEKFDYKVETNEDWIKVDSKQGSIQIGKTINVSVDWDKVSTTSSGQITITGNGQTVKVNVKAEIHNISNLEKKTFVETHGVISIEADHTSNRVAKSNVKWETIQHYGRTLSSVKMFPSTVSFEKVEDAPYLEYKLQVKEDGEYTLTTYTAPTNNLSVNSRLRYGISFDEDTPVVADSLLLVLYRVVTVVTNGVKVF